MAASTKNEPPQLPQSIRDFDAHHTTAYKWMRTWQESGFYDRVRLAVILEAEKEGLIDFTTQAIDGSHGKSRRGRENCGPSPVDRAKGGIKRSVHAEGHGYPLAVLSAPGNVHDAQLLAPTLAASYKPTLTTPISQTLIMDRGYRGAKQRRTVEAASYIYRAPPRNRKDPYAYLDIRAALVPLAGSTAFRHFLRA